VVTVRHCFDLSQAQQLKTRLEAAGIPAFIPDEISAGIAPYHFFNPSGVRLQVSEAHVEEARALLASEESPDPDPES
jgi:hypothetical protein